MDLASMRPNIDALVEGAGVFLSLCSVLVIVVGILVVAINYFMRFLKISFQENFKDFQLRLSRVLVVALEILVIADVIETVTVDLSFESLATLAILVIARTWLSWSLEFEAEGKWPWQSTKQL